MGQTADSSTEKIQMDYSHDYPGDTHLTYTRNGNEVHLLLTFQSEDPDMGIEEMQFNAYAGESFAEMLSDSLGELSAYLDRHDTSSFYKQQGNSPKYDISEFYSYYGEFSRTSLYAFEGAMKEAELRHSATRSKLPSEVKLKTYSGYHENVFEGWKKLDDATIRGDGYKVEFSRLSVRKIDQMCDALNGWYNIWTKFLCEYTDAKGTLSVVVQKAEEADKLSKLMTDLKPIRFEHEDPLSEAEVARIKLESLISFIKPSIQSELKKTSLGINTEKGKSKEMEI